MKIFISIALLMAVSIGHSNPLGIVPLSNELSVFRNVDDALGSRGFTAQIVSMNMIHNLRIGFVLANGSMSSNTSGEGDIRKNIIEADLVDCMIALPGQLFYSTQIPVCLWSVTRSKINGRGRNRQGETLFIDARKMGTLVDRVHRELTAEDLKLIASTYHTWRGDDETDTEYKDIPGYCNSSTIEKIREHGHILTPGRYVGAEAIEDDGEPFEEKMERLTKELMGQFEEAGKLENTIKFALANLTYTND